MKKNSDAIEKSAHLAEAKLQRSEREKGELERAEVRAEREAASRHREGNVDFAHIVKTVV